MAPYAKFSYEESKENAVINFTNGGVQMFFQKVITFIRTLNFKKLFMNPRRAK